MVMVEGVGARRRLVGAAAVATRARRVVRAARLAGCRPMTAAPLLVMNAMAGHEKTRGMTAAAAKEQLQKGVTTRMRSRKSNA